MNKINDVDGETKHYACKTPYIEYKPKIEKTIEGLEFLYGTIGIDEHERITKARLEGWIKGVEFMERELDL